MPKFQKTPFFPFARHASIGSISIPRLHVQRSGYVSTNLSGEGTEGGGGSDDDPERMSTASVMEMRIQGCFLPISMIYIITLTPLLSYIDT